MNPVVSIVMPVYNGEKTLHRALQSIAAQTYRNFETVIVDNNCTDSSMEIALEYSDAANITIVKCNEPGIVPALNTGLKFSKGNWIARQDADDYWHSTKLEKQMKFLSENPDIEILGTQIRLLDEAGNVEEVGTFGNAVIYPSDDQQIKTALLIGQNPICHPSVIYSKKVILLTGGYEKIYPLAEDLQLWLKAIPHVKFSNLKEILVDYTQKRDKSYDARVPLLCADTYYNLYKVAGLIEGNRPQLVYDWQMKERGWQHS